MVPWSTKCSHLSLAISGLARVRREPPSTLSFCTCTGKLQSCGKQPRGAEALPWGRGERALRRGGGGGAEPGEEWEAEISCRGSEEQGGSPQPEPARLWGRTRQPMAVQSCTADGVRLRCSFLVALLLLLLLQCWGARVATGLPDAGMGGLLTHTTIFLALGKLGARWLPEAAAARAGRVSAACCVGSGDAWPPASRDVGGSD